MKTALHILVLVLLCIAAGIEIIRFARRDSALAGIRRAALTALGIGFLIGGIYQAIAAPTRWIFALYLLGAYLCYTGLLFSFPDREAHDE